MKCLQIIFFVFAFTLLTSSVASQQNDLFSMATGTFEHGSYIFDEDDNIWGYFYIFDENPESTIQKEYQYIILDNNLATVAKNRFKVQINPAEMRLEFLPVKKVGDNIFLRTNYNKFPYFSSTLMTFRTISLTSNEMSPEYLYNFLGIHKLNMWAAEQITEFANQPTGFEYQAIKSDSSIHLLVVEQPKSMVNKYATSRIQLYDENHKRIWKYYYNIISSEATRYILQRIEVKDDAVYLVLGNFKIGAISLDLVEQKIICLDRRTGSKRYEYMLNTPTDAHEYDFNMEIFNDELHFTGFYQNNERRFKAPLDRRLGFYKIIIDANGEELLKKKNSWISMSSKTEISKSGEVDKKYFFNPLTAFNLISGKTIILAEKTAPPKVKLISNLNRPITINTTDLACFYFDENFKLAKVDLISKEKTKDQSTDFLFSQYVNNKADVVFFHRDYPKSDKDKNRHWILGIHSIIDGNLSSEQIPLTSDNHAIIPARAKEGHIMFREINKDEKYDMVRLEKLNY